MTSCGYHDNLIGMCAGLDKCLIMNCRFCANNYHYTEFFPYVFSDLPFKFDLGTV